MKTVKTSNKYVGTASMSPEAQRNRCIALAANLAEQQLADGTASAQVIVHYLKLGTELARLQEAELREKIAYTHAKTEAAETNKRIEDMYKNAVEAMRVYSGASNEH